MKDEKPHNLRERTKQFALDIIQLYSGLPKTTAAQVLGKQLLRSGTSVGAQFREANRAKSDLDFISKIEGALQELDETSYWLELLDESQTVASKTIQAILAETDELISVFVTIAKSIKQKIGKL
jgi:four helix bundle protein